MRYLILSDIHANLEAFQECLKAAEGRYDQAVCLGDVVGYGPDPNAVVSVLRKTASVTIRGNHDKAASGITDAEDFSPLAREAILWTRRSLTLDNTTYLRQLPPGPQGFDTFEMVHGSATDEDEYVTGPAEAIPALRSQAAALVFFGHTHRQGGFALNPAGELRDLSLRVHRKGPEMSVSLEQGTHYLINPGSVGQPRDRDWKAAFAILDDSAGKVYFYRVPYKVAVTQMKMTRAGLPQFLIDRLQVGA